ncbi:hypothetical protein CDAR_315241 [Caerostris darwini]|uniref:Uncharacterized protein n=1 Tax=Caerostris darwini TaxID=1538125 RepID=A0AAV4T8R1_9ARAC|nr:hypothetical protein CDAR_315241 [Caerostris darwini]
MFDNPYHSAVAKAHDTNWQDVAHDEYVSNEGRVRRVGGLPVQRAGDPGVLHDISVPSEQGWDCLCQRVHPDETDGQRRRDAGQVLAME